MILLLGCGIYVSDYYHADNTALAALEAEEICQTEGYIAFPPEDATKALIFYPGGNVEAKAYAPLMKQWYIGGHSLGGSMAASYKATVMHILEVMENRKGTVCQIFLPKYRSKQRLFCF